MPTATRDRVVLTGVVAAIFAVLVVIGKPYFGMPDRAPTYPQASVSLSTYSPWHCSYESATSTDSPQNISDFYRSYYLNSGWLLDRADTYGGTGGTSLTFHRIGGAHATVSVSSEGNGGSYGISEQFADLNAYDECHLLHLDP